MHYMRQSMGICTDAIRPLPFPILSFWRTSRYEAIREIKIRRQYKRRPVPIICILKRNIKYANAIFSLFAFFWGECVTTAFRYENVGVRAKNGPLNGLLNFGFYGNIRHICRMWRYLARRQVFCRCIADFGSYRTIRIFSRILKNAYKKMKMIESHIRAGCKQLERQSPSWRAS